ncbi:protein TolQ [Boseongicola aestuarii]|jgi:biopolymer transport protein TolQ|uniref:Tol-Pal system protein TolQ n=1 Tax=Boseongicola aestuarii TaxID=1470561 RepID=A0A238IW61_9RHOB|nr:protein TolQ [Boseongicola aestuarii]SMX22739.1 Biopolymer transport protein ExbB [Boseongicola aestuarii]
MEQEAIALASHADFSMWALFARASLTVKLVMVALILASVWAWAIIYSRTRDYRAARAEQAAFEEAFWSGEPLDQLFDQIGPSPGGRAERIFVAGMTEWRRSHRETGAMIGGAQVRIDRSMDVAIQKETESLQVGLPVLATVGSTAPFVGLFGTVWGIMVAFIEIGQTQSTSLAVVAPGIAEALLATGLGLAAAIPAVIFYNKLSTDADKIIGGYESFADEFATILSRQMDAS